MKLNRILAFAREFAWFSQKFGIPPAELAEMCAKADVRCNAYTSNNTKREGKATDEIIELAGRFGCTVEFNGLWPTIKKNGEDRLLPCQS